MRWHLIEGEEGCRYAREHRCAAVVVDALRASATATMILHAGATEILAVRDVADAFAAKAHIPEALLYGERGGVPPAGFDHGNSPREAEAAAGHRVIFTTTTGAGRLVSCWGAKRVFMGCPLNAAAVAHAAASGGSDIVVIPAGLAGDPTFDAQEDWAGAAAIVMQAPNAEMGEGAAAYHAWKARVAAEGLPNIFVGAPHAEKLRRIGFESDIMYCAQMNTTSCVPVATGCSDWGVVLASSELMPQ